MVDPAARSSSRRSLPLACPLDRLAANAAPVAHPIARALIGKSKGDTVEVAAPGGARSYEIVKVEFK